MYNIVIRIGSVLLLIASFVTFNPVYAEKSEVAQTSHDGLVLHKGGKADLVYVLPGADLSAYKKIMLMEAHIAFKKNWKRDQNRDRSTRRVTDKDMARIISRGEDLFDHVFTDVLEENGYPVVTEPGEDVLIVRPAIIDLNVTAPDVKTAGRSRTYVSSAGEATLFIELYDSVTRQILARAFDHRADRNNDIRWSMQSSSISNTQAANRALKYWAGLLAKALDKAKNNN
jgi:hypothetical protein